MARIHLFEFEDQQWFPDFLRDYATDFLQLLSNKTKMYRSIIPIFVLWDGLISSLRTYSIKEMNELTNSLENKDSFNWEARRKNQDLLLFYIF